MKKVREAGLLSIRVLRETNHEDIAIASSGCLRCGPRPQVDREQKRVAEVTACSFACRGPAPELSFNGWSAGLETLTCVTPLRVCRRPSLASEKIVTAETGRAFQKAARDRSGELASFNPDCLG